MKEKVDSGDIIMTSYFNISPYESVESLQLKSMNHLLYCFEKIIYTIIKEDNLPKSNEVWERKPFTRKDMLQLFEIDPKRHSESEIEKRIRAADYPGTPSGAFINLYGSKFIIPCENRKSIIE